MPAERLGTQAHTRRTHWLSGRPLPPLQPRIPRANHAERRARFRRETHGYPSPADRWISRIRPAHYNVPVTLDALSTYDVKCRLEMKRTNVSTPLIIGASVESDNFASLIT